MCGWELLWVEVGRAPGAVADENAGGVWRVGGGWEGDGGGGGADGFVEGVAFESLGAVGSFGGDGA